MTTCVAPQSLCARLYQGSCANSGKLSGRGASRWFLLARIRLTVCPVFFYRNGKSLRALEKLLTRTNMASASVKRACASLNGLKRHFCKPLNRLNGIQFSRSVGEWFKPAGEFIAIAVPQDRVNGGSTKDCQTTYCKVAGLLKSFTCLRKFESCPAVFLQNEGVFA